MTTLKQYKRVAALGHNALGMYKVKVIFRNITTDNREDEKAYWMDREIYQAIPLGTLAFIQDYAALGKIEEARSIDIYNIDAY